MARESLQRLFLALPFERETIEAAAAFLKKSQEKFPQLRWVHPADLHLTLHYFGLTEISRVPLIGECTRLALQGQSPFLLQISGLGVFPEDRAPRILWADVAGQRPAVSALQQRLCASLRDAGFEVSAETFRPHVTLARGAPDEIQRALVSSGFPGLPSRKISSIALFESRPSDKGQRYEILETFALAPPPPQ